MSRITRIGSLLIVLGAAGVAPGAPGGPPPGAELPSVQRGLGYLRSKVNSLGQGEASIVALAMVEAGVPARDPGLAACVAKLQGQFDGKKFNPECSGGHEIYEIACVAMTLANLDPKAYREQLQSLADRMASMQASNGSWDYANRSGRGDSSMTQYALLGLWMAAEQGEARISPQVWDRAARWFLSTQVANGGFMYHPDDPNVLGLGVTETLAMGTAGVGSLLICQNQLAPNFKPPDPINPLLIPIEGETTRRAYRPQVTNGALEAAIKRGLDFLGGRFVLSKRGSIGTTGYYALYGIERVGALSGQAKLGAHDWFAEGRAFVEQTQDADGSWNTDGGPVANTAWAVLFLVRANAGTVRKIKEKRLGAGTLLGGRGLPKDLSALTVAGGRIVVRPMNGAVEGMLKVLEDPNAENADAALAGLLAEYDKRGPSVLAPLKDRFRKLLSDKDPGIRRIAAWALPRTREMDVVPILIGALRDPDPEVMVEARNGLQLLARKAEGYGPTIGATPDQAQESMRKWRDWYNSVRPIDQAADQGDDPVVAAPVR